MKSLEKAEKEEIKFRFAVGLHKAFKSSNFKSYRQFATEAGMEQAHMQKIVAAKLDVTLTTIVSLARALSISYAELINYFENVNKKDISEYTKYREEQKSLRGKKKAATKYSKQTKGTN